MLSTSVKVAVLEKLALDLQCSDLDNDLIPNLKQMILFVINGNYEQEDFTAVVPIETIFLLMFHLFYNSRFYNE